MDPNGLLPFNPLAAGFSSSLDDESPLPPKPSKRRTSKTKSKSTIVPLTRKTTGEISRSPRDESSGAMVAIGSGLENPLAREGLLSESDEVLLVGKSKPALSDALADQKKRGSMVLKRNKLSKTSSHKLHSSVYSKKQITAAIRIQKWYRVRRLMSAIETALFFNKRRRAILKEILATEESYLASLTVLSTQFMDQLKSFFSEVELMNVFIGVKELLSLHGQFFSQLRHNVPGAGNKEATAVNTQMASLLVSFAPQFEDVYTKFLTNQDKSRRMMEAACARSKELVAAMDKITDRNGSQRGRQFFDSLMTGPMQRLPRYQLLLREYQKHTNPMYPDVRDVVDAINAVAEVTLVVNENKRDQDELHMREMLERNSSMECLELHTFEVMTFSAMRNCAHCEKAIWGLTKSGVRCTECSSCFHTHCQKPIAMQRLCPRRKKLDFSLKKLTYLQEVLVIPFNPDLHVASVVSVSSTASTSFQGVAAAGVSPAATSAFAAAAAATPSSQPTTPAQRRVPTEKSASAPTTKPVHRSKAVLCFFDDGLGIAHIRSDDAGGEKFDFMGDLPWSILDECVVVDGQERESEWVFAVKARFQEWRFALPTKTEQEAIVAKLNEARKLGSMRKRAQSVSGTSTPSIIKK